MSLKSGNANGVQKSMHHKVPWKTGMLICHPVTSRSLIFLQNEAVLSPRNFMSTRLQLAFRILSHCDFATREMGDSCATPHKEEVFWDGWDVPQTSGGIWVAFQKLRISRVIPRKSRSFPEIQRAQNQSRIPTNNSQGIIFMAISCQRATLCHIFWVFFCLSLLTPNILETWGS